MILNTHYAYGAGVSVAVSISGDLAANGYYCFVQINNVYYGNMFKEIRNFPANLTITPGTKIIVGMSGSSKTPSSCYVNGKNVMFLDTSDLTYYTFTPTGNCTIVMNSFNGGNRMNINY